MRNATTEGADVRIGDTVVVPTSDGQVSGLVEQVALRVPGSGPERALDSRDMFYVRLPNGTGVSVYRWQLVDAQIDRF